MAEAAAAPALQLEGVTCTFPSPDGRGRSYTAVQGASFTVADGEFVSIVGPTGSGKSTMLNVAAGLLKPSEGRARSRAWDVEKPRKCRPAARMSSGDLPRRSASAR
jgi:NitT/TauT family transport system ATP-binding protein